MRTPQFVLLRGLARGSGHWGSFPDVLQRAVGGAGVTLMDLPGNGARCMEPSPLSIQAMTQKCRSQWQASASAEPVVLVGLSMGGMVAVEWAQQAPQDIAGVVLINSSMRPWAWPWQRLRPGAYGRLLHMLLAIHEPQIWEQGVFALTTRLANSEVLPQWRALHRAFPPQRAQVLRQLWAAARYCAPGRGHPPHCPTLILASGQDGLVSMQCSVEMAKAWAGGPGVAMAVHPAAGHDLPLDDADWVCDNIATWCHKFVTDGS